MQLVLTTCEAAMHAQLGADPVTSERACAVLAATPADLLFRRGFARRRPA
jgi:hypothetical protein